MVAGTQLTYVVQVTNSGPSDALNVVIEDNVPAGVVIDSVTPSGGPATCNSGVPGNASQPTRCAFDTLANGASRTMTIVVTVLPDTLGILHNDARVHSAYFDPDNSDDLATTDTTVNAQADLSIVKTDFPDPVIAGTILTYELLVANGGPSLARDVLVIDSLPDEVVLQTWSVSNGTGTCTLLPVPPNTVSCDLNDLAPGENVKVYLKVLVLSSVPDGTVISDTASVSSKATEINPVNNTDTETTGVLARADLRAYKDGRIEVTNPGPRIKYTITVVNNGPSDALNVVGIDTLPLDGKKVPYVFDNGNGICAYVLATHKVTCNFGTIPAGQSRSVDIYVDARGSVRVITNIVTFTTDTTDPILSNNTARKDLRIKGGPGTAG